MRFLQALMHKLLPDVFPLRLNRTYKRLEEALDYAHQWGEQNRLAAEALKTANDALSGEVSRYKDAFLNEKAFCDTFIRSLAGDFRRGYNLCEGLTLRDLGFRPQVGLHPIPEDRSLDISLVVPAFGANYRLPSRSPLVGRVAREVVAQELAEMTSRMVHKAVVAQLHLS